MEQSDLAMLTPAQLTNRRADLAARRCARCTSKMTEKTCRAICSYIGCPPEQQPELCACMQGACQLSFDQKARLCREAGTHARTISSLAHERFFIIHKLAEVGPVRPLE